MTTITITVQDADVRSKLAELAGKTAHMGPVLRLVGEGIVERTKRRFETSTGPDGQAWQPNSVRTLAMVASSMGAGKRKKDGSLNKAGQRTLANKKPLIGNTRDLSRQFVSQVGGNRLTILSTPLYAAIQQFGGQAGRGKKVRIPARPFLPVRPDGTLYPQEQAEVVQVLDDYLADATR